MASNDSRRYFEDIKVGDTLEHGEYEVTKEEILEFAEQYDPQPFHVDEEAARESMYGDLIASGWHTAAICMKLLIEGEEERTASAGGRGADELRWHRPVYPGDTISVQAETVDKQAETNLPGIGHVNHDITGLNQHNEPVITWTALALVEKRGTD